MVHITEMRVPLPMTVKEFKKGQRYANWKTNEANTTEGQGGQLLATAPHFDEIWGHGVFTHNLYRLGDRLPDWVTRLVPANALVIDEKSWITYPYCRSVHTVPFFQKLKIEIITLHADDDGSTENILQLGEAELAMRKVDMVDIALDKVQKRDYKAELDPLLISSNKSGRGPLKNGWQKDSTQHPMMCAYKLVKAEANYWGVQSRAEKLMLSGIRQIVLLTHRNAFGYIDEWFDLSIEEISARETQERQSLKAVVKQPPIIDPNTGLEFVVESKNAGDENSKLVNRIADKNGGENSRHVNKIAHQNDDSEEKVVGSEMSTRRGTSGRALNSNLNVAAASKALEKRHSSGSLCSESYRNSFSKHKVSTITIT
ncbi:unnamed protein product [Calypogeia fissa]